VHCGLDISVDCARRLPTILGVREATPSDFEFVLLAGGVVAGTQNTVHNVAFTVVSHVFQELARDVQ
jgi:hypothetical protein